MRQPTFALLVLVALFAACTPDPPKKVETPLKDIPELALKALESSPTFELISLDPDDSALAGEPTFHDWKVLGQTNVDDAVIRKKLILAMHYGVSGRPVSADCFDPRHGIRVRADDKEHDFVICFECGWIEWYIDGTQQETFNTNGSPGAAFDIVLHNANVKLPNEP